MEKRKKWGEILASLGGLLFILNITVWPDSKFGLPLALLAAALAIVGAMMAMRNQAATKDPRESNE